MVYTLDSFLKGPVREHVEELTYVDAEQRKFESHNPKLQIIVDESIDRIAKECEAFEVSLKDPAAIKEAKVTYRKQIEPIYSQSFFMDRSTRKPQGYAGDFETIEGVYNSIPLSTGIGLYLDMNFMNQKLAVAVRNRKDMLREKLVDTIDASEGSGINIFNLACGSCREWNEILPEVDCSGLTLINIDHDQDSLDYSKNRLSRLNSDAEIAYVNDNALKIAVRKNNAEIFGTQDVVYSVGLYDYLSDKVLGRLLKSQHDMLDEGGKMILAFKDKKMYDQTRYDWTCDWLFVQRDEPHVDGLMEKCGFKSDSIKKEREQSGIIIFYEVYK